MLEYYCEIKGKQKELSSGLKIVFDFGESQVCSIWGGLKNKQRLVDENAEEIEFNGMVDALRVRPLIGIENLTSREYSSEYYIQISMLHMVYY